MHMFPNNLVVEIARETTDTGRKTGLGHSFEVTEGHMWLFLGCKHYMSVFPQEGSRDDYWAKPGEERSGEVFLVHNLGQYYGMSYNRYRAIERAFTLPTHGLMSDPFNPIRLFIDKWNNNMFQAFVPGGTMTVDESMTEWLGQAMPGLMVVPRKPTDTGREGHTTACTESGILIFYEAYEGSARMESKEFVAEFGKNPAKALRCVKNWFHSGRLVLVDSGFASVELAMGLAEHGLLHIGNVKTAHTGFPKDWLLSQVKERGDRAICTAEVKLKDGSTLALLATADRDKQPMALLGSAGCTSEGRPKIRRFTTIRVDGTYFVREAVLNQMHIHDLYRSGFNTLDKHNAIRQGENSVEGAWHTHRWWVREFQGLWGMSEVNAWLAYRRFVPGQANTSYAIFRRKLCFELLHHPKHMEDVMMRTRSQCASAIAGHKIIRLGCGESGSQKLRRCSFCPKRTSYYSYCSCTEVTASTGIFVCSTHMNASCIEKHLSGLKPFNRRSSAQKSRWAKQTANHGMEN